MQQISVERLSNLIGGIYDCAIEPERWTGVLDEICAEFGFATGALSVASLTNKRAGVNAVSGSDLAQMAQNGIAYGADIIELWGGVERISTTRSESRSFNPWPSRRTSSPAIAIIASGPSPRACSTPLPSASFATG